MHNQVQDQEEEDHKHCHDYNLQTIAIGAEPKHNIIISIVADVISNS